MLNGQYIKFTVILLITVCIYIRVRVMNGLLNPWTHDAEWALARFSNPAPRVVSALTLIPKGVVILDPVVKSPSPSGSSWGAVTSAVRCTPGSQLE
jgi:hypothetical protein